MKHLVLLLALAACANPSSPSALNQPPGKYRDYADYLIAHDPSVQSEIAARGANPEQAHCAAEKVGWLVFQGRYPEISAAVSGRGKMTIADEQWAANQYQMLTPEQRQQMVEQSWDACL